MVNPSGNPITEEQLRARIKADRLENLMARQLERELLSKRTSPFTTGTSGQVQTDEEPSAFHTENVAGKSIESLIARFAESAELFNALSAKSIELRACMKDLQAHLRGHHELARRKEQSDAEKIQQTERIKNLLETANRQKREIELLDKIRRTGASKLADASEKISRLRNSIAEKDQRLRENQILVSELEEENRSLLNRIFELEDQIERSAIQNLSRDASTHAGQNSVPGTDVHFLKTGS